MWSDLILLVRARPDAVRFAVVVLLGIFVSLTLWLSAPGLFGLVTDAPNATKITARVVHGVGCAAPGAGEIVTFVHDGTEHQAKLDACGHQPGEPVQVAVPAEVQVDMTVHAAEAATGQSDARRPVAYLLFLLACLAGGGFSYLYGKLS
ncbi:hypothetical protein LWC34_37005 [Kibdelosporangium philippinense]|uniref:DUF3592 domain-containing protein n=1 Tax=Kibdelosporangium philippinense TaxID=211113 RepID=A0ABS8ZLD0_9PSEU|nr:hypothetical protein [Kibdelosporangium philippinense]MCE7008372.1 hypothetical protein [Kibdelosporangium philippinense]